MPILENFLTEEELANELKDRCGFGEVRTLRSWRARVGPPWRCEPFASHPIFCKTLMQRTFDRDGCIFDDG